jgi:hypothetical protein
MAIEEAQRMLTSTSNQNMKRIFYKGWPYFPYLLFSTFLIFAAIPLTDEAWFTYPALTFLREGKILDVRWCAPQRGHAFTMETASFAYALWYKLGGINIVWGRMLGVIAGLVFLIVLNQCFCIIKVPERARKFAIALSGVNYFFLISTTQIRPEGLTLFSTGTSLYMYLGWQQNTKSFSKLLWVHVLAIFAALLHWQAVFAGVGIWVSMFLVNRKEISYKRAVSIFSLYIFTLAIIYFLYIYSLQGDFIKRMDFLLTKSGPGGTLHPHAGGVVVASIRYLETSQYLKLLVAIGMIVVVGIGLRAFWNRETGRKIIFIYGGSCYISWIATTSGLNDFHACWLVPAFMMMIIEGYGRALSQRTRERILGYGLAGCLFLLSVIGCIFAARTIYLNPRLNIYESDLKALDSEFNLRNSTVFGEREIMWYFKFDPTVTFPVHGTAEYFIGPAVKAPDSTNVCNNEYELLKKGQRFALYQRVTGRIP